MTHLEPERFQFTSPDGLSIACVKWSGHHRVRGVVQIAHGLGEHMGRYAVDGIFRECVPAACRSERDPESANGSSYIHFLRKRRSSWTKVGRSPCARGPLSQCGYYVDRSRFLSGRSARDASRTESPRGFHKSARLDFRHPGKGMVTG